MWVPHKEWYGWYAHAWGAVRVTSDKEGQNPFPVDSLKATVVMPSPNGDQKDFQQREHVWEVSVDVTYKGSFPVFSEPKCSWLSIASHKGFGEWTNSMEW
jgi:hypothetical protein